MLRPFRTRFHHGRIHDAIKIWKSFFRPAWLMHFRKIVQHESQTVFASLIETGFKCPNRARMPKSSRSEWSQKSISRKLNVTNAGWNENRHSRRDVERYPIYFAHAWSARNRIGRRIKGTPNMKISPQMILMLSGYPFRACFEAEGEGEAEIEFWLRLRAKTRPIRNLSISICGIGRTHLEMAFRCRKK